MAQRMVIMQGYACPHCGKLGISFWRKQALGPAVPATCRSCSKAVGVPWWSMLGAMPLIGLVVARGQLPTLPLAVYVALLVAALLLMFFWQHAVPLVKR